MVSSPFPEKVLGRRANLLLLAASVAFSLFLGEIVARALLPPPLPWLYPQVRFREVPGIGFGLIPGERAYTADKVVLINSRGLRGDLIPYRKAPGKPRFLFLGDSIVFGYGVDQKDSVSERLSKLLQVDGIPAEVINTGVPAYGIDEEIAFLEQEGVRYEPDYIILGFCWNDINDNAGVKVGSEGWLISRNMKEGSVLARFLEGPFAYGIRNLSKHSRIAYAGATGLRSAKEALAPDDHFRFRKSVLEGRDTVPILNGWARVERGIQRLKELSLRHNFRSVVVAFPLPLALEGSFPRSGYPRRLREIAAREGVPFLDLEEPFRRAWRGHNSLFIPYDADHPNAAGHDLAAKVIRAFLDSEMKSSLLEPTHTAP
jgi:lysophospholipase L1-like esterase